MAIILNSNSQTFGNLASEGSLYEQETKRRALEKISLKTQENGMNDKKAKIMYSAICDVLKEFCNQNVEFAEAVLQTDKTVGQCAEEIGKSVKGNGISDITVYREAAQFYFPGSKVEFQLRLYMSKYEKEDETEQSDKKAVVLNLFDLM